VLAVLALVLALGVVVDRPAASASPTASGRFVYVESLDRGNTFRIVLTDATGAVERVLAQRSYGRPAFSPDGSRVAYSAPVRESLGRYALFVVDVDGANARQVTAPAIGDFDPAWSPTARASSSRATSAAASSPRAARCGRCGRTAPTCCGWAPPAAPGSPTGRPTAPPSPTPRPTACAWWARPAAPRAWSRRGR
jgi:dipeptidyl aminopeptidase/acylaminoacyl peptidase